MIWNSSSYSITHFKYFLKQQKNQYRQNNNDPVLFTLTLLYYPVRISFCTICIFFLCDDKNNITSVKIARPLCPPSDIILYWKMVITTRIRKKTKIQKKAKKTKDNNELVDFKNQINQLIFCQCCKKKAKKKKGDNTEWIILLIIMIPIMMMIAYFLFFVLSPFYKNVGRFFLFVTG